MALILFGGAAVSTVVHGVACIAQGQELVGTEGKPWLGFSSVTFKKGFLCIHDGCIEVGWRGGGVIQVDLELG
eukprot:5025227-Ditylum_brightwellii.AAC.2